MRVIIDCFPCERVPHARRQMENRGAAEVFITRRMPQTSYNILRRVDSPAHGRSGRHA